jgi:hypothetical protein
VVGTSLLLASELAAQEDLGIPYSSVFRSSSHSVDPALGYGWNVDPQLKVGPGSLRGLGIGTGLNASLNTPLNLSARPPQDATLTMGPLALDIPRSYFELIASDNADREKHSTESGVIAMFGTDFDLFLEFFPGLVVTAHGRFIWLPFEGEAGFQGRGAFDARLGVDAGIDLTENLFIEAAFDTQVGDWDVFVRDRIGIRTENSSLYTWRRQDVRLSYIEQNRFDESDQLGRFTLGGNYGSDSDRVDEDGLDSDTRDRDRWSLGTDGYYNFFTAGASRTLPTDTRFSGRVFRYDRWGADSSEYDDGTYWSHGVNLSLYNQHYNMRFKPYATYTATENSENRYWEHVARLGIRGPITEYTSLDANVGRHWRSVSRERGGSRQTTLWRVSLHNELNALTTQRLSYSREVAEPESEIHTILSYSLHRVLGPNLNSSFFATWTEEDESDGGGDHDETRYDLGARITWDVSSRLTLRLTGLHTTVQEQDTNEDYDEYRVRLSSDYRLTDTLSLWVSCEHTFRDDEIHDESYRENLLRMRLTKIW